MDNNKNIYQQNSQPNYFPYGMYAATNPYLRQEVPAYMIPQTAVPAILRGRPVTSFEEARVAQIDLDGSISFFPDIANKKIYTKRINPDGTAALQTYALEEKVAESIQTQTKTESVTRVEFDDLKQKIEALIAQLS